MQLRRIPLWSILFILLVLVAIAGYNYWAYNCGYCAIKDMKRVGPQVMGVVYLIFGAGVSWLLIYGWRRLKNDQKTCQCGRKITTAWSYCPDCGTPFK
ncbi:MAG: hypothetical protein C0615_03395 [Desulfuromonas sp.]|nr:MAG: hypothetical protein C0615_03395 [Desulfuromonas sp.]